MRKRTVLIAVAALSLLLSVIVIAHLPGPGGGKSGSAVGETPADFTVTCLDGSVFTLSEFRRGGCMVVINLWATWCGPCVKELPDFDRLQREFPNMVAVLALHTEDPTEDVAVPGVGRSFDFAVAPDASLPNALGGGATLPRTVVIAPDGRVIYNQTGSLAYETLERLVLQEAE